MTEGPCKHQRCETKCSLTDYVEYRVRGPDFRVAEITIACLDCGRAARFSGVHGGLSPDAPMVSFTADELRAPVIFQTDDEWASVAGLPAPRLSS